MTQPKPHAGRTLSNVWIYSFNPKKGTRSRCQLPTSVLEQPSIKRPDIADLMGHVTREFDLSTGPGVTQEQLDTLTSAAIAYAKDSDAWAMIPSQRGAPSVHLVVLDWSSAEGTVTKLIACNGEVSGPLPTETVNHYAMATINSHVLQFPSHKPI